MASLDRATLMRAGLRERRDSLLWPLAPARPIPRPILARASCLLVADNLVTYSMRNLVTPPIAGK